MRRLVFWAMGMGLGCGLWLYAGISAMAPALAIGAGLISLLLSRLGWKRLGAVTFGLFLGLVCCISRYPFRWRQANAWNDTLCQGQVRISDYSEETNYGVTADGRMTLEGKTWRVRVYLNGTTSLEPGMTVSGTFRIRSVAPGNPEKTNYFSSRNTDFLLYPRGEVTIQPGSTTMRDIPARVRQRLRLLLDALFPADTRGFAKALLLGDTSGLDYETDTALKISGIRHIVAISGLHVSIFFGALETLTLRKRYLTALVGFPGLLVFAALMGFSPSVSRACIMVSLMLLARLLNREYDGPTALAFAVAVILGLNPGAIASISFQLSVASVAGIYLFQPGIQKWLLAKFGVLSPKTLKTRFAWWFSGSVSVSLGATILTTPLCAWYFGTVSLVAVVTNLMTLWMVSILFYGLCLTCLLGQFWLVGGKLLAWALSWGFRYVLVVAKTLAKFPLAAVYTTSPYIVAWLVFVYALLAVFWLSQNRYPWVLGCCACLGLCLALMASWLEAGMDDVRITVLDVGQGQSILLQTEGRSFLVDCGGDSDTASAELAAHTLLSQGITKLDGLILTHCDRDHAGGVPYLLTQLDVALLIQPENGTIRADVPTLYAREDLVLTFETGKLEIFAPAFPGDGNECSLCVLLDTEKCDILITGDRSDFGERSLLQNADIGRVDVLVAGHHGSKNSTSSALLEAVQPQIVCISAGADNPYGHPAAETLERLAQFGCRVYRTDQLGTIIIRR